MGEVTDKAKAAGATSGVRCETGSMMYMLVRLKSPDRIEPFMKSLLSGAVPSTGMPYVKGTNWLICASGLGGKSLPTTAQAQDVQKKVGGSVAVIH